MGRHNKREHLYQLEVLDFSKQNGHVGESHSFMGDIPWNRYGKMVLGKESDMVRTAHKRTILCRSYKDAEAIKRWAGKFGSIISCQKVGTSPNRKASMISYLENIEHLNLRQETLTIEIEQGIEIESDNIIVDK